MSAPASSAWLAVAQDSEHDSICARTILVRRSIRTQHSSVCAHVHHCVYRRVTTIHAIKWCASPLLCLSTGTFSAQGNYNPGQPTQKGNAAAGALNSLIFNRGGDGSGNPTSDGVLYEQLGQRLRWVVDTHTHIYAHTHTHARTDPHAHTSTHIRPPGCIYIKRL